MCKYIEKENQTSELCLEAVRQNGSALQYVAPEFKEECEKYLASLEEEGKKGRTH